MCLRKAVFFSLLLVSSLCLPMFLSALQVTEAELLQALEQTTNEYEMTLQMNSELRSLNEEILRHNKVMSSLLNEQESFTESLLRQRNEDTRLLLETASFYEEREQRQKVARIFERTSDVATGAGIGILLFLAFSVSGL